jgi:peptidoglycan-associated lipoprotein
MRFARFERHAKLAALLCLGLSIAACAKTPGEEGLAGLGGGGGNRYADGAGGAGRGGVDRRGLGEDGRGGHGNAVPGSAQDFAENVGDRVFFESDQTELTAKAQGTLDRQVAWLQRYDRGPFTIEGHADERGTREYNFALGARRAESAKQYLIARGIPASRIRTISYGKERPVAVCNDISCWSQNRRAVTVVPGGQS